MIVSRAIEYPALHIIFEIGHHNLVKNLAMHRGILNGYQRFNPPIHITIHPIGRRDEQCGMTRWKFVTITERNDSAMFQETSDDTFNPDIFG